MDGVVVDLVGGVLSLYGVDPTLASQVSSWGGIPAVVSAHSQYQVTSQGLWATVGHAGPAFWADLQPYPWAVDLYQLCAKHGVLVCSTPASPGSAAGKLAWLSKWLPDASACLVSAPGSFQHPPQPTSVKRLLGRPGALLVDDHPQTCQAFELASGESFTWPAPWNGGVCTLTLEAHHSAGWQALERLRCLLDG